MAYCGPRGIPLSVFLAWSQADQQAALAWNAHESRRCSSCGTHPDDWNPGAGGDRQAFHAEPRVCLGCEQMQARAEEAESSKHPGLHIALVHGSQQTCPDCLEARG